MIHGKGVEELKRFIQENPDWLVIDHSQLEKWETCPRKYRYVYVDHMPGENNRDAAFSNVLHGLFSQWYKLGGVWLNPDAERELYRLWGEFEEATYGLPNPQANRVRVYTHAYAWQIFNLYIGRYRSDFEAYEVVDSENVYFRELLPNVLWISKPDLVLRRRGDGDLVTLDFKHSVWEFGRTLLAFDRQFVGQAYAAESKWMIKAFIHSELPRSTREGNPVPRIDRPVEPTDGELLNEWLEETRLMVEPVLEARKRNVYPKRAPRACMDFNRMCEFHELCEAGKVVAKLMIDAREKQNPNEYLGL